MTDKARGRPIRPAMTSDPDGLPPKHPTRQAILLLVGVTLLIVALAVISSSGGL